VEGRFSSHLQSPPPWAFSALLLRRLVRIATVAAASPGLWSRAVWSELIRFITPIFLAMLLLPTHMASSDRGMALGRWRPTVIADVGCASAIPTTIRREAPE